MQLELQLANLYGDVVGTSVGVVICDAVGDSMEVVVGDGVGAAVGDMILSSAALETPLAMLSDFLSATPLTARRSAPQLASEWVHVTLAALELAWDSASGRASGLALGLASEPVSVRGMVLMSVLASHGRRKILCYHLPTPPSRLVLKG